MFNGLPDRTVCKYYLYRAVGGPGFIVPIYILYMLAEGLTFAQIGVIGAIQSGVVLVGEMPTGYVGDRIGRRNSLLVGQLLYALSAVGMIIGGGFVPLLVSFAMLSFGQTFVSGSGDAWLYDMLSERLNEDEYTRVRGRGGAIGQWVSAATMVVGGGLYVLHPVLPFVALLVMRFLTGGVLLTFPQNARYTSADSQNESESFSIFEAMPLIRKRLARPPLRSFVGYMALFLGAVMTVGVYVQPIAKDALQTHAAPLFTTLGIGEVASLGLLYAAFTVVSAIASDHASEVETTLGVRGTFLFIPLLTALLFVVPVFVPILAVPMFFGMRAARSLIHPIAGQYINDQVESVGRATLLSAVSMIYAIARIPYAVGSGLVADAFSPLVAVSALGVTFIVGGGIFHLFTPPVRTDASAPSAAAAPTD